MQRSLVGGDLTTEQRLQKISDSLHGLQGVAFEARRQVKTYLMYKDNIIPKSDKVLDYFFDCNRDAGNWTVHVTSKLRDDSCFYSELAKLLNKVAGGFLRGDAISDLAMILRCPMTDIHKNLEETELQVAGRPVQVMAACRWQLRSAEHALFVDTGFVPVSIWFACRVGSG
jgi:hypothetical protein